LFNNISLINSIIRLFVLYNFIFLTKNRTPKSTLFPYTTLFRSMKKEHPISNSKQITYKKKKFPKSEVRNETLKPKSKLYKKKFPDRKSTRLNSSHEWISYAVFCLKKKKKKKKDNKTTSKKQIKK